MLIIKVILGLLFYVSLPMSMLDAVEMLMEEVKESGTFLMGPGFATLQILTFIGFAILNKFVYTEGMVPYHQLESLPVQCLIIQ